jgi:hypothetical protein
MEVLLFVTQVVGLVALFGLAALGLLTLVLCGRHKREPWGPEAPP